MTAKVVKKSLRERSKAGTDELDKLTGHMDEMLAFDLGKCEMKAFDETAFGPWSGLACPILVLNADSNRRPYEVVGGVGTLTPLFQSVLASSVDAAGASGEEWMIGRLVKRNRAYVLDAPTDAEWEWIEEAIAQYESDF